MKDWNATTDPYMPLLECDVCHCPQRHERAGSAAVPERDWKSGSPIETGGIVSVEVWSCRECGSKRPWGIVWSGS